MVPYALYGKGARASIAYSSASQPWLPLEWERGGERAKKFLMPRLHPKPSMSESLALEPRQQYF